MKLRTRIAGQSHLILQSSLDIFGAGEVSALSCVTDFASPVSINRTVSRTTLAPNRESLSCKLPASSSGPMGVRACRMIFPVSTVFSRKNVVTPVSVSPFMIAQLMGAAPRYRGRSEAWRLIVP